MFVTSYCLRFNLLPILEMTLITCLRSFGQKEEELKFINIPQNIWRYIDHDDLLCFKDDCDVVLKKNQKQAISTLCMIERWMVYRFSKRFFDSIVNVRNQELTKQEKQQFHAFAKWNPFLKKGISLLLIWISFRM